MVVSYSEYVLVTQIPQKFGSHGSLQTHLRAMVCMTRKMLLMKVMAMTMFSSVWKVLSQQSRLGSSQQLLMVPIHLNLHTCTLTLVDLHTYTLVDFKHSNEFTHILHVHVIIHLLLDRYFLAHEQLHIQHILA